MMEGKLKIFIDETITPFFNGEIDKEAMSKALEEFVKAKAIEELRAFTNGERVCSMVIDEKGFIEIDDAVFGFGYGDEGDGAVWGAVKEYLSHKESDCNIICTGLAGEKIGGVVVWLIVNAFIHHDLLDYGTSPRVPWLTEKGIALKEFIETKTVEELCAIIDGERIYSDD